ncbi:SDR family NAD(P)-dependent oxidoreductase [Xenorhabdus bharatensis]|uniref:SDR family NAD(P)-dependent oxidoreductase n=1 Tax=Xenorhabdus bharatensis TaxID=3136256 RepID=UPI0030F46A34
MIVMVTGATSGFGEVISKKFLSNGHKVIGIGRRVEKLLEIKNEFQSDFHPIQLDLTEKESIINILNEIPEDFKNVDILVNNAGLALGLEEANLSDINDWNRMIDTNVKGLVNITHSILPIMVNKNSGHIINIGSTAANWPYLGGNVYGATKAFVKQFSRGLRADLFGKKIRVTNIEPGLVKGTEFSLVRFKGNNSKVINTYKDADALTPEDIAESVFWVSNLPAHVNINEIEMMPVCQSFAGLNIYRE